MNLRKYCLFECVFVCMRIGEGVPFPIFNLLLIRLATSYNLQTVSLTKMSLEEYICGHAYSFSAHVYCFV